MHYLIKNNFIIGIYGIPQIINYTKLWVHNSKQDVNIYINKLNELLGWLKYENKITNNIKDNEYEYVINIISCEFKMIQNNFNDIYYFYYNENK